MVDIQYFKSKLEAEKKKIEEELAQISVKGKMDSNGKTNWEAVYPETELEEKEEADPTDAAEEISEYEERFAMNDVLERRLNNINDALAALAAGKYGICKVGGKEHEIEKERLEANPASITCIAHLEE